MKNFELYMPTRIIFGKDCLGKLNREIKKYGTNVLLTYGGGSIKRTGIYDLVMEKLNDCNVFELGGIHPNPRIESVRMGAKLCKEHKIDVILAVGGGSTIDCSKVIAAAAKYEQDAWDLVMDSSLIQDALPIIDVLTLSATGSETNSSAVISDLNQHLKLGLSSEFFFPKAAFLNPEFTYTVPVFQSASGMADIFSHLSEIYFNDDNEAMIHQSMMEGIYKTLIHYAPIILEHPDQYEARANVMWSATMALNGLFRTAFGSAWSCHPMEHTLSAYYDVTHGAGLAVLTPAWMEYVLDEKSLGRFADFGRNVWQIQDGSDEEIAHAAIEKTKEFLFKTLRLPSSLSQLGVSEDKLSEMAQNAVDSKGGVIKGFRTLEKEDVLKIYQNCF